MGVVHTQSVQKGKMVLTWKMRAKITGIVMADQRTRPPKKQLRGLTGNKVHSPRAVVAPAVKTASERIREAAGQRRSTLSTYKTYFNLFKSVCRSHALDPWVYSVNTALKFMAYMLERETHGRVCHDIRPYFTAANHFYEKKGLGRPWAAKRIRQLNIGYQRARSATSKAEGRPAPRSRVTVPHMMIERICKDHEQDEDAWRAIFLIMLMTGLRADSAGALRPENVRFVDGSLVVDVLRCKTDDEPRTKVIRAPQRRDHFRHRAFAIVNMGAPNITADMFGSNPSNAITEAMQKYVRPGELAPGTFVSSHSWRKTGASILWRDNAGMVTVLAYGGWAPGDRTYRSVMRYIDKQYANTPHTCELLDSYHVERGRA